MIEQWLRDVELCKEARGFILDRLHVLPLGERLILSDRVEHLTKDLRYAIRVGCTPPLAELAEIVGYIEEFVESQKTTAVDPTESWPEKLARSEHSDKAKGIL